MILFLSGLIIFFGVHFYSTFRSREADATIVVRLGYSTYMTGYSLLSAAGLTFIALGYFGMPGSDPIYKVPFEARTLTIICMGLASILIAAAYVPSNHIARALRHPMLIGVSLWAGSHLLSRSEARDLLLFGSFLIFAIVDILVVNRRNMGKQAQVVKPTWRGNALAIAIGLSVFSIFAFWLHVAMFGVAIW